MFDNKSHTFYQCMRFIVMYHVSMIFIVTQYSNTFYLNIPCRDFISHSLASKSSLRIILNSIKDKSVLLVTEAPL